MNYDQFKNLSCYEEFEIQSALLGISKINILKEISYQIDNYYFFISEDGLFNWYDLAGNHINDPGVLTELRAQYIPKNIIRCVIPDSVKRIGDYAFTNCSSLEEITISNSVISINYGAFAHCESLKEIIISDSVTHIGYAAFVHCESLKEITIPDSVKRIGDCAFTNCYSLEEIVIPNSVTSVGYAAFAHCESLNNIIFKGKTLEEVKQMENFPFGIGDEIVNILSVN